MSGRSLFVGLGNPGAEYAGQRHNIGFMAVDAIARRHRFSSFRGKFHGEICEGRLGIRDVLILKPMTYMNESGIAVAAAARFFKIPLVDITVFHDELDLAPGKVRVKRGGGHAGHNGLRSIDAHLGADFGRIRLGIGHPGSKDRVLGYVLGNFSVDDRRWLDPLLDAIAENAGLLAAGDDARFMSRLYLGNNPNGKDRPEKVDQAPSNLRPKDGI